MSDYQVQFSGQVAKGSDLDVVQSRLARELGIDEQKARTLFSGRTVVIRSKLLQAEAEALQQRLADLGAITRIKSLAAPRSNEAEIDKDALRMEGAHEQNLKDITAAHVECPRCGHMALEASHCSRCGIDIASAMVQKRKEDLLIEKKIQALRSGQDAARPQARRTAPATPVAPVTRPIHSDSRPAARKKTGFVRELFRRS